MHLKYNSSYLTDQSSVVLKQQVPKGDSSFRYKVGSFVQSQCQLELEPIEEVLALIANVSSWFEGAGEFAGDVFEKVNLRLKDIHIWSNKYLIR